MTTTTMHGRLGNQIIRNLSVSLIAEKHNLFVSYCNFELIKELGIDLFVGKNIYNNTIVLSEENYLSILNNDSLNSNVDPNSSFFQTKEITNLLYEYLQHDKIKSNIMNKNPFNDRYNKNNDLFIHIRLTDVAHFNPGIQYYLKTISTIEFDKLYISTDDKNHDIIRNIFEMYPNTILVEFNEINTFQFASTCKNIILSHGSFSAIIGYLSFFSNIYYPEYENDKIWYGDMFTINGWNKIKL